MAEETLLKKKETNEGEPQRASASFSPEQLCLLYRLILALQWQEDARPIIKDPAYTGLFQVVSAMIRRSGVPRLELPDPEPEEPETDLPLTREEVDILAYVLKTLLWNGDPSGVRHRRAFRPLAKKVNAMNQEVNAGTPPQEGVRRASSG